MFVHNLDPVLITIGPVSIHWYGVIYAFGFILTYWWLLWLRSKGRFNLSKNEIGDLIVSLVLGVVIGARLFEVVIWNPSYYLQDPVRILFFWQGGMSFHGGLVGAILAVLWYVKGSDKVTFWNVSDAIMVPAFFATGLGRIGNFINGELPGRVSSASWCVEFPSAEGCRHPQMIYSAIGRFVSGFALATLDTGKRVPGWIFGMGLVFFGLERLVVDIWREDILYYGLTTGQWLSIPVVLAGLLLLWKKKGSNKENNV